MIVLEEKTNKKSKDTKLHEWIHDYSFDDISAFKKFINWTSGDFTLYQQDEIHGLTIYFPNGWFSIKEIESTKNPIKFRVLIESSCLKSGTQIFHRVSSVLQHVIRFYA